MGDSAFFRWPDFEGMPRSEEAELLDAEVVPEEALAQAYRELRVLHGWLGNTRAVLRLLRNAPKLHPVRRVLDIGCGQGALLVEIRQRMGVEVAGFDLRPAPRHAPVAIFQGNAVTDALPEADVAVCVVMAHHLSATEVAELIQNVARSCNRLILLDLVRHPVPLALFQLFVRPFLCRINGLDGQTSIRRAYTAREMRGIVDTAMAGVAAESGRPVKRLRHTVAPLWIRQVVDLTWETVV